MASNILQCHSKGDKRFSAFYAKIKIQGKMITIEEFYQNAKRLYDGSIAGKGKPFDYLYIFDKVIPKEYCSQFFLLLWIQYFIENKNLYEYACTFDDYLDIFKGKSINNQEDAIRKICKNGISHARIECKEFEEILKGKTLLPTITKDIFDCKEDIIGHQTNCKGVMGKGIAKTVKEKYPNVFDAYRDYCNTIEEPLGTVQIIESDDKYIANIFGQYSFSNTSRMTDYDALGKALTDLKEYCIENKLSVALPYKIGCVNAGGDWTIVEKLIHHIFYTGIKIPIVLYKLDNGYK